MRGPAGPDGCHDDQVKDDNHDNKDESKSCNRCECCARTCMVIVNVLFQILGAVLLITGIILKTGWGLIDDYILPLMQGSSSSSDTTTASSGVSSDLTDAIPDLLAVAAWVFIALGLFMMIAGIMGCCGACCKIRNLIIVYVVLVGLVFLTKLIFIILVVTATLNDQIKGSLKDTITDSFISITDTSVVSIAFNVIMIQYSCCGVESYTEFHSATKWERGYEYESNGVTTMHYLTVPVACCKVEGSFPDISLESDTCLTAPDDTNSNMNTGCWSAISAEINKYKTIVIGAYSAILLFEVLCIAVAIYMIMRTVTDEKHGKVNPWTD